jgi:transposase
VNQHDTTLLPQSLFDLADIADLIGFDLDGSYLTLDSGFDGVANKKRIELMKMIPVIKPNRRGIKDEKKLEQMYGNFNEQIYKTRFTVERTFGWQDTYRKLVIRYEKLEATHNGFKYLAYSMMNLRAVFGGNSL